MTLRPLILLAYAFALGWSLAVVQIGTQQEIPVFSRALVEPFFFLAPGLVILAMIAVLGLRRLFDPTFSETGAPTPGSGADVDQRVLTDTIHQAVLGLCLWTPISFLFPEDGLGVAIALSLNFAAARVLYWIGAHVWAPLRAFGYGATFYPTLVALIWGGMWWALR